ncbi:hypothetical protein Ahy_B06g081956 isoform A [Arachis hypogaea]|uniref:Uncharacterized protein n=1 Tax=Arachis hypogaea TaxID=3818 RepID=A0A444YMH9_ARAHY|nr:hypothetical protein Ahy_B06g081956 isoform A [Arachis hypogaea]
MQDTIDLLENHLEGEGCTLSTYGQLDISAKKFGLKRKELMRSTKKC